MALIGNPAPEMLALAMAGLYTKVTHVDLLADLKNLQPTGNGLAFIAGKLSITDQLGGFYYWDAASGTAEDTVDLNYIVSNQSATGRWVRLFQKVRSAASSGKLVTIGNFKLFATVVNTDANGDATFNVTEDGTANGVALFGSIMFHNAQVRLAAATIADAVYTTLKSDGAKQIVYRNTRMATTTLLSILVPTAPAAVPAGVPVMFFAVGA